MVYIALRYPFLGRSIALSRAKDGARVQHQENQLPNFPTIIQPAASQSQRPHPSSNDMTRLGRSPRDIPRQGLILRDLLLQHHAVTSISHEHGRGVLSLLAGTGPTVAMLPARVDTDDSIMVDDGSRTDVNWCVSRAFGRRKHISRGVARRVACTQHRNKPNVAQVYYTVHLPARPPATSHASSY